MGRTTRGKKADIVSAAGYMASWWTELGKAGAEAGLENADYYPLGTDEGRKIAANVVAQLAALRDQARSEPSSPKPVLLPAVHVAPLVDKDVPEVLGKTMGQWRTLAADLRYNGPVAWRVQDGFTLKQHAPLAGPCRNGFQYLQDWALQNDAPTRPSIVFWIPRLLRSSTGKTAEEQLVLMATTRTQYGLPEHHLSNFGSVALLSGLVLAHHKLTRERVPLRGMWARTDTLRSFGARLSLGHFGEAGLRCVSRHWDDERRGILGAFPLGEELGL